jgi:hypothetical protein
MNHEDPQAASRAAGDEVADTHHNRSSVFSFTASPKLCKRFHIQSHPWPAEYFDDTADLNLSRLRRGLVRFHAVM